MSQTERVFYIDRQIRRKGRVTSKDVEATFEVSNRQAKRDIEYLRDRLGAPIEYDPKAFGYVYTKEFETFQNADERMLVFNAVFQGVAKAQGLIPMMSEMLQQNIDLGISREYRHLMDSITYTFPVVDLPDYHVFGMFCSSMDKHLLLDITYSNAQGVQSQRKVEPLRLISYSGRWYVVVWDFRSDSLRTFHMSRIRHVQLTDIPFQGKCSEKELQEFLSSGFGIFMGGHSMSVTIRIMGKAVYGVETQVWHKDQKITPIQIDENGEPFLEITLPVSNLSEILSKVLSFGEGARPISPPEFVQEWEKKVRSMMGMLSD